MVTPAAPPPDVEALRAAALAYLRDQLGPRAPTMLAFAGVFDERPLDGEGRTALFSFELPGPTGQPGDRCDSSQHGHYVAIGDTTPNYFPAYRFTADEAYEFHLGTRFMLTMGVSKIDTADEPPGARERLRGLASAYSPDATLGPIEIAGLFRCEDDYFAVYRVEIDGEPYFSLGADCPPGFYRLTEFPPQTTLRLHLGTIIRHETSSEAAP